MTRLKAHNEHDSLNGTHASPRALMICQPGHMN
jgi:hypothetical protein